jgi:hypothetical protein
MGVDDNFFLSSMSTGKSTKGLSYPNGPREKRLLVPLAFLHDPGAVKP